jgi:hypothetical protein
VAKDLYHACDNRSCPHHHVGLDHPHQDYFRVQVPVGGTFTEPPSVQTRTYHRHLYRSVRWGTEFKLCDVCHAAVEMCLPRGRNPG